MSDEIKKLDKNLPAYLSPEVIPTIYDEGLSVQEQISNLYTMILSLSHRVENLERSNKS